MKNRKLIRLLCLILCAVMLFAGCASDDGNGKKKKKATEAPKPTVTEPDPTSELTVVPTAEPTPTAEPAKPVSYDFSSVDSNIGKMIREAVEQYNKEDYTPLDEPVKYYVLWLGFTHVTFGDLDFQMTDFDREYLQAVTLNYEKSLESISNHNVDITVYFHLIDDTVPLTQAAGADWLYLDMQTVMPYITHYMEGREIDTVLTTVQTAGEETARSITRQTEPLKICSRSAIISVPFSVRLELHSSTAISVTPLASTCSGSATERPSIW